MEALFPAFLRLAGRKVVLVGGGSVAAGKHAALVAAGAEVTVVAPRIGEALRTAGTTLVERGFQADDLEGAWFAVAAATPEVNRAVLQAALPRRLFVNAVDDPPSATAFAGSVARRGPVTIAVSTAGTAPALAALVRQGLESLLPDDLDRWVQVARDARARWRQEGVPILDRRPLLLTALNHLYDTAPAAASMAPAASAPTVASASSAASAPTAGSAPPSTSSPPAASAPTVASPPGAASPARSGACSLAAIRDQTAVARGASPSIGSAGSGAGTGQGGEP